MRKWTWKEKGNLQLLLDTFCVPGTLATTPQVSHILGMVSLKLGLTREFMIEEEATWCYLLKMSQV